MSASAIHGQVSCARRPEATVPIDGHPPRWANNGMAATTIHSSLNAPTHHQNNVVVGSCGSSFFFFFTTRIRI
ncbi:hypothetical protein O9K51_04677 [Purpureocillium lavendulum]|uniref:Uncharacterized protein n=1 Tax=Purpureocillium lavendulum TaxID=1247861 RepID=A0AB34FWN8_9HYPO|nr:hypothetical protein O9K51_04677 [Purpureocillium lavendulum]